MNQKLVDQLNIQINKEMYSAYLYQSMAAYFESLNLKGFAIWMDTQAEEERTHARKIYDYIIERGGRVVLDKIDAPRVEWNGVSEVFEEVLEHEKYVTEQINNIYELSRKERDYATEIFLQWFVTEQIEEESTAEDLLERVKAYENDKATLYMLDAELGKRNTQ